MDDLLGGRQTTSCTHTVSSLPTPLQPLNNINIACTSNESLVNVDIDIPTASSSNDSSKRKRLNTAENKNDKKSKMQFNDFVMNYFMEKQERAIKTESENKEKEQAKKQMVNKKLELEERKLDLLAKLLDKIQ